MITKLKGIISYLRGDVILLKIEGDMLTVYAGNNSTDKVKEASVAFFKQAYTLNGIR